MHVYPVCVKYCLIQPKEQISIW